MTTEAIEVEAVNREPRGQTMAIERVRETAVGKALTIDELQANLNFVRDVMRKVMKEDQDYGVIPGTGQKPTLLQPGAQKLLLTFNLTEEVKKEVLREYPNFHREYEFTITVCAPNGKRWDGVGTCSTLETKYRYRKAERVCPSCGKKAIIAEKEQYLKPGETAGWMCWKKKDGCGTRFRKDHPGIAQDAAPTDNPDPADCWNTVRKMAFKRALVAAAINATNTSELWTQDLEEGATDAGEDPKTTTKASKTPQERKAGVSTPPPASKPQPPPAAAQGARQTAPTRPAITCGNEKTLAWMIRELGGDEPGALEVATEYFQALEKPAVLLPNEPLTSLPLEWVPITRAELAEVKKRVSAFANGDPAVHPYKAHELPEEEKKRRAAKKAASEPKPPPPAVAAAKTKDPEWFFDVICPIPNKGQKRDDYMKKPDTIRSLYFACKAGDEGAGKRLWGFANHYEPTAREHNGKVYQPTEADKVFRTALDAFLEWEGKHGKDTHQPTEHRQPNNAADEEAAAQAELAESQEEDDVPF